MEDNLDFMGGYAVGGFGGVDSSVEGVEGEVVGAVGL